MSSVDRQIWYVLTSELKDVSLPKDIQIWLKARIKEIEDRYRT